MDTLIFLIGASALAVFIILTAIAWRPRQPIARCPWCDKNDIPLTDMAIFSYKNSYGGFTGVCKTCLADPTAEARYHRRLTGQSKNSSRLRENP